MVFRAILFLAAACPLTASTLVVKSAGELKAAIPGLKAGDILRIAPGDYPGGFSLSGLRDLTIEAQDPGRPPHFKGGTEAWHFSRCPNLVVRNLRCSGQTGNGLNVDDGGKLADPVPGTLLEGLLISDIGPVGNFDAIKCSGLEDLSIRGCEITGWGGQAIDLVGCHRARIEGCRITGKEGYSQHTGPQFKGGCSDITIERCVFKDAGERPIQAGGSTGADFFRPPGANYEASRIFIRDNRIEGGTCACAFTGVDGAEFTGNTIIRPEKWIFRILQETKTESFLPCGNVKISGNKVRFRRGQVADELNIGPDTAAGTFVFEGNRWLAEDKPEESRPRLPVEESGGIYGQPPE